MTCRQNTPQKFFVHLTADTIRSPQCLCLMYPLGNTVPANKLLSYLGPRTWNTLPAQIKLRRNVNTFKHDIKKLFFDKLEKDLYLLLAKTTSYFQLILFVVYLYTFVSLYSPRDHNENKVYH